MIRLYFKKVYLIFNPDVYELRSIVKSLISRKHEEEWFEYKENWFEPHALGEYISALSNAAAMAEWCKKSVLYRAGRDTLQQRKILKKSRMTGSFFSGKSRN